MEVHLRNKQILITGGTSALGRAFVKHATEEGATAFFNYHKNREEANHLEALGARGYQIDLSNRRQIDELKKQIQSSTHTLDGMIHNAAIVRDHTIQNLTVEEWDEVLSVNLGAVYYLTKKFLSLLFKKPGSKILNIVSRVGFYGGFGEANYAAAKAGLIALTKSLARELGRKQILVNGLSPGFMKSRMTESVPEEIFERNRSESPLGVISDPEHVADFMIYLLSDRFQNVTGQIFHLDSRGISLS